MLKPLISGPSMPPGLHPQIQGILTVHEFRRLGRRTGLLVTVEDLLTAGIAPEFLSGPVTGLYDPGDRYGQGAILFGGLAVLCGAERANGGGLTAAGRAGGRQASPSRSSPRRGLTPHPSERVEVEHRHQSRAAQGRRDHRSQWCHPPTTKERHPMRHRLTPPAHQAGGVRRASASVSTLSPTT
ncbi:hypothetical protein [Streptomyces lavendulae]|uniref:hypothetical protein n=1 Tax=Streptomyces lavendulae TaxID=1914 RepID=UPI00381FD594